MARSATELAALSTAARERARGDRPSVPDAAMELGCSAAMLRQAARNGVVQLVPTGSGSERCMERAELERVKRECRCAVCGAITLGKPTADGKRYCRIPEHRGGAIRGKTRTPEQRARMSEAKRGRKFPAITEANRKRYQDLGQRNAARIRLEAALATEEDKARQLNQGRAAYTLAHIAADQLRTVGHVREYWVGRGLLQAERPSGFHRLMLVPICEYKRFKSDWVKTADGTRTRWWDEEVVLDCARRTGRVARLAEETGRSRRQIEEEIRRDVGKARQRLKGSDGGRPPATSPSDRDLGWAERFVELRESRELMELGGADRIAVDEGDEALQRERAEYEEIRSDSCIFRLLAQELPGVTAKQIEVAVRRLLGSLAGRTAEELTEALERCESVLAEPLRR